MRERKNWRLGWLWRVNFTNLDWWEAERGSRGVWNFFGGKGRSFAGKAGYGPLPRFIYHRRRKAPTYFPGFLISICHSAKSFYLTVSKFQMQNDYLRQNRRKLMEKLDWNFSLFILTLFQKSELLRAKRR